MFGAHVSAAQADLYERAEKFKGKSASLAKTARC